MNAEVIYYKGIAAERLMMTDEEAVKKVLAGETALFEILMRRYNQRLYRIARSVLKNDSEAEDVVQDAYVRAYSKLHQFAGDAKFSTWLTKIALYEAFSRMRKSHRFVDPQDLESIMPPSEKTEDNPETRILNAEMRNILDSVIKTLPDKYRLVFMMREAEGLSTQETAECLEINEQAVKTRLFRARALLRRAISTRMKVSVESLYYFAGDRCDRIVENVMRKIRQQESIRHF